MKYIKNTGRYAIAFSITKNDREFKLALDKRRIFTDTGNIATTGITPVEEKDLEELKKQKRFVKMLERGELKIIDESEALPQDEVKAKALEEENIKLKAQLKEAEKAPTKKELKAKDDEIASLKSQLEALTKKGNKDTEAEGF